MPELLLWTPKIIATDQDISGFLIQHSSSKKKKNFFIRSLLTRIGPLGSCKEQNKASKYNWAWTNSRKYYQFYFEMDEIEKVVDARN